METASIILGFSDIKSDFVTKNRTNKSVDELKLRFRYFDNVLHVEDFDDRKVGFILALWNAPEQRLRIFLKPGTHGRQLVQYVFAISAPQLITETITNLYRSHGFIPFRRF